MGNKELKNEYSRSRDLSERFNAFWNTFFNDTEDYFHMFQDKDFVNLKKATHNIDNIITLQVTKQFVKCLLKRELITSTQKERMEKEIEKQHPNANGYDIEYPLDADNCLDEVKIIAEVKCNLVPEGKKYFDPAGQTLGITNDLKNLAERKRKSKIREEIFKESYKFMVLLDGDNISKSILKIINIVDRNKDNKYATIKGKLVNGWPLNISDISNEKIYIVAVPLNKV